MNIARVFATKTNMCPTDENAYFGEPDLFTPIYDEAHISITFTWAIRRGQQLADSWRKNAKKVKIGGIAVNGESTSELRAGMYLKKGITITSRGCPNKCSFCLINQDLIELRNFPIGNIIQDNNILACSRQHLMKVFNILKTQKSIEFKGGLQSSLVTTMIVEELRGLRIKTLWLACDYPAAIKSLKRAVNLLQKNGFNRNHLYCYVLIGKDMQEEEARLREVFNIGCIPFAQLYRNRADSIKYSKEWKQFQRRWARPAIIKSMMQK